jgi:hypothetical protein
MPTVRSIVVAALWLLGATSGVCAQSTPAIGNGMAFAQAVINSMPNGADRQALQAGLDSIRKLDAGGRVCEHPAPGGTGGSGDAFTHSEFDLGDVAGSGPEVGAGNERTDLGPDLVDPSKTDPGVLGQILIHEGIRSMQSYIKTGPLPAGSTYDQRCQFWRNELEAYRLDEKYCHAAMVMTIEQSGNMEEAEKWSKERNKRRRRVDYVRSLLLLLNCP